MKVLGAQQDDLCICVLLKDKTLVHIHSLASCCNFTKLKKVLVFACHLGTSMSLGFCNSRIFIDICLQS